MLKCLDTQLRSFRFRAERIADELDEPGTFSNGLSVVIRLPNLDSILLMGTGTEAKILSAHGLPPCYQRSLVLTTRDIPVVSEEHKEGFYMTSRWRRGIYDERCYQGKMSASSLVSVLKSFSKRRY